LLTNRQTDKQTNKVWQKHNLLGGGNKHHNSTVCSNITLPVAISMRTQPRLQTSAALPDLSEPVITSGAMNATVHSSTKYTAYTQYNH